MKDSRTFNDFIRMARAGLTNDQIFTSAAMKAMFENIASFVTERYDRRSEVIISSSGKESACTDGNQIHIDVNFCLLDGLDLLDKVKACIGMIYHECGHILFTDFVLALETHKKLMRKGELYPSPEGISEEIDKAYEITKSLFENTVTRPYGAKLLAAVHNCVEDGAIENFLKKLFPGYAGCLKTLRTLMFEKSRPIDEIDRAEDACIELILQQATSHEIKGFSVCERFDLSRFSDLVVPVINRAIREENAFERSRLINAVFALMIQELDIEASGSEGGSGCGGECSEGSCSEGESSGAESPEDKGEGKSSSKTCKGSASSSTGSGGSESSSDGSSSDGEPSSEGSSKPASSASGDDSSSSSGTSKPRSSASSLADKMRKAAEHKSESSTAAPKGTTSSVDLSDDGKDSSKKSSRSKKEDDLKEPKSEKELDAVLSSAMEDIKKDAVEKAAGKAAEEALIGNLKDEMKEYDLKYPCQIIRPHVDPVYDESESYERDFSPIIKKTARMFSREIDDRRLGEVCHGKIYGKAIDTTRLYRVNGGKMMTTKNPEDTPDMAVMCLVDESGSMSSGGKIPAAKSAAYIVNGFCEQLSLPLSIYGHTEAYDTHKVQMISYREYGFDGDRHVKQRLMDIHARCNNRDGFAIRYCTKKLAARDEHIKLMIIISDGAPAAHNYSGTSAAQDVRKATAEARKAGITVVTAGIGSDRESIQRVYQSSSVKPKDAAIYLDISDLNSLSKELVKIIKRNVRMVLS